MVGIKKQIRLEMANRKKINTSKEGYKRFFKSIKRELELRKKLPIGKF